jgi:hypothetical protein
MHDKINKMSSYYPFPAVNLVAVVENIGSRRPFFGLPQATLTKKDLCVYFSLIY